MQLILKSLFICMLLSLSTGHTLLKNNDSFNYTESITPSGNTFVSVEFKITSPVNSIVYAFAKASLTGYAVGPYQKSDFYGKKPQDLMQDLNGIDLQGLWMGKKQVINLKQPPSGVPNVFVSVFNLDPSYRKTDITFDIVVTHGNSAPVCQTCISPSQIKPGQCVCERCPGYLSGYDCSRQVTQMTSGSMINGSLSINQLIYFQIPATEKSISVFVETLGGEIQVYFQQINFPDEVASYVNVAVGTTGTAGAFRINERSNIVSFEASYYGSEMSLVIGKYIGTTTNFKLIYEESSSINIMAIVLGILGGILFIGLIAASVFIYRRFSAPQQGIINIFNSNAVVREVSSNRLTSNQIQRYFPEFQQGMLNGIEESKIQMKEDDKDCVICLCPIESYQRVRMGFCRHTFHSACLLNWFKKQRNCPYCREDFSKSNTVKHFTEVVRLNGNRVLEGNQLVKAVTKYNHLPSSNKASKEVDSQLVHIQSGQEVVNQNQ